MRKIIIASIAFIAVNIQAKAQTTFVEKTSCSNAIEYNDYLVEMINTIDKIWTRSLSEMDLTAALKINTELKTLSGKMIKSLKKLQGYGGESAFKNATNIYITHMNKVSKKELPAFLKLIRAKDGLTTENAKKAEALIPALDQKREQLFTEFENAQAVFAKEHGYTIEGK